MSRSKDSYGHGPCAEFWKPYSIRDNHEQPGNPKASNEQPSDKIDMSSDKAKKILKDNSVHGHPLSPKQKGLFGVIAGKGE